MSADKFFPPCSESQSTFYAYEDTHPQYAMNVLFLFDDLHNADCLGLCRTL